MIDQATIDRIVDSAQIVDVISEFVTLRKRGQNHVGLCPFHDDTTPSFYVSPTKGIYKCFACGKGGNVVNFIMEHEQISYVEALRYLARKYGIEIEERDMTPEERLRQSERESMFIVNEYARDWFQNQLLKTQEGQNEGMAYFRSRGFRDDIIQKFQLGYSPQQADALTRTAQEKGYNMEYLTKTGLSIAYDDGRLVDRYRGRVIFPIHSISGKVIAFGGRVLASATKGVKVKYINSPESEVYHKSDEIYGIFFAKQAIVKQDCCFLVEGYTDVISMHQSGIENVVSSSGTSLTQGQIRAIKRFTTHLTVLYDGDWAGIKASLRGIDMLLKEGMSIKVCLLPDGEDPDSFARKHRAEDFRNFIHEHEVDFMRFKTSLLLKDAQDDPIQRAELTRNLVESIAVIPDAIVRDVYIKECSLLMGTSADILVSEVARQRLKDQKQAIEQREREAQRERNLAARGQSAQEANPGTAPQEAGSRSAEAGTETPRKEEGPRPPSGATSRIERYPFDYQERDILKLIISYGEQILAKKVLEDGTSEDVSVIEYIWRDLKDNDLSFLNPIHRKILNEAYLQIHTLGFISEKYFVNHMDPKTSQYCASLISTRYQLSKYHFQGQKMITDKDRLPELVPDVINSYKAVVIQSKIKGIMRQLQDPSVKADNGRVNALFQQFEQYKEILARLCNQLGERIITK